MFKCHLKKLFNSKVFILNQRFHITSTIVEIKRLLLEIEKGVINKEDDELTCILLTFKYKAVHITANNAKRIYTNNR